MCYDCHKRYFEVAKSYADILIVSITTDKFVKKDRQDHFLTKTLDLKWLLLLTWLTTWS